MFQFACVLYMPIGDALTIVFTEPLWTLILSKLILKIRIGLWKVFFGLLLILGMILCIQPPFLFQPIDSNGNKTIPDNTNNTNLVGEYVMLIKDSLHKGGNCDGMEESENYNVGVLFAIGTAVTGAMANVVIARCEKVSSKVLVFYSGLGGVILAFICSIFDQNNLMIFNFSSISINQWMMLTVLGLMGIVGYFSMTRSLRLVPPTTVAVLRAMEIILAYIAQVK